MLATIAGKPVHVNGEGFLAEFDEWDEDVAATSRIMELSAGAQTLFV